MSRGKVVIGLSGGVDSSVAAYLLKEEGYEVIGLFMINWHDTTGTLEGDCPWYDDRMFAELVAKKLDIPFNVVDLSDQYRKRVVDYMFSEYEKGRTPNPDVLCNREIKFDAFINEALKFGADYVATGHYCRKETITENGREYYRLLAGSDPNKDQSYFLCQLSQEQLSRALFPIGHLLKPEVREIAAREGLATAKRKDSQGICFVGKVDLPVFLQQKLKSKKGDIVEIPSSWDGYCNNDPACLGFLQCYDNAVSASDQGSVLAELDNLLDNHSSDIEDILNKLSAPYKYSHNDGAKVGAHNGAHFFTIGQRKGLMVGGKPEPLFVISTDVNTNTIYVGMGDKHPGLYRKALRIRPEETHWIRPDLELKEGECRRFSFRIRYRQPLQKGTLIRTPLSTYILFDSPQRSITAGQFASWYDGEELVGSGVISQ